MFCFGFIVGTVFGIFLVAMLGVNKYEEGYDKGYAEGRADEALYKK